MTDQKILAVMTIEISLTYFKIRFLKRPIWGRSQAKTEAKAIAIFHASTKSIARSAGRSSVAAAAYRSGTELVDMRTGLVHDYTWRDGVFTQQSCCRTAPVPSAMLCGTPPNPQRSARMAGQVASGSSRYPPNWMKTRAKNWHLRLASSWPPVTALPLTWRSTCQIVKATTATTMPL